MSCGPVLFDESYESTIRPPSEYSCKMTPETILYKKQRSRAPFRGVQTMPDRIQCLKMTFLLSACILISISASADDLPLVKEVTQYGITWEFESEIRVGQFVNGDYYVVGPVTVIMIDPIPGDGRNGSVLNQPANNRAGYDSRILSGRYVPEQAATLPIQMKPGDSLISTISGGDPKTNTRLIRKEDKSPSPVRTAAVLTCLAEAVPGDTFRPGYCDRKHVLYSAGDLRRDLLPKLARVESTPSINYWASIFQRPWVDTVQFEFALPYENMPSYGREIARAAGVGSLLLCLDYTDEEKEELLVNFVQVGIDLWSAVKSGYGGWPAHGGHGSGRKWIIVLSGILLGDEEMQSPKKTYPKVRFGEDMQTMYGTGWTGATALYAGHVGKDGLPNKVGWGAYEHLHPRDWEAHIGESYRRCCTSSAWVGEALAARILHVEEIWGHPAFFDYVDRWMTEDDREFVHVIKLHTRSDYTRYYTRQGFTWDVFVKNMWEKYRKNLP